MERRLLNFIMTPAMAVTWILGIVLVIQGRWMGAGWFQTKFVLVIVVSAVHGLFSRWVADFRLRPQPAHAEILSHRQ